MSEAPSSVVQRQAIQAKSLGRQLSHQRIHAWSDYKEIEADRSKNGEKINALELQISGISDKLVDHKNLNVAEKEQARKTARRRLKEISEKRGANELRLSKLIRDIDRLKGEIDRLAEDASAGLPLVERRKLCDQSVEKLEGLLGQYERHARQVMEDQINVILSKTAHKNYQMEISENFALRLLFSDGSVTPKSGGENQLLSLAFIAALVDFAEKRTDDKNAILVPGTVAPLVLDSPFGQLDPIYKKATASFVPDMASQVVLLVSSSQGSADVLEEIAEYIGKEYVLVSENRGGQGERKLAKTEVGGASIAVTRYDMDRNQTRIEEVH